MAAIFAVAGCAGDKAADAPQTEERQGIKGGEVMEDMGGEAAGVEATPGQSAAPRNSVTVPARKTDVRAAEDMRKIAAMWHDSDDGITRKQFEAMSGIKGSNEAYKGIAGEGFAYDFHYPDGSMIIIHDLRGQFGSAYLIMPDDTVFADENLVSPDTGVIDKDFTYDDYVKLLGQDGVLTMITYFSRSYLWVDSAGRTMGGHFDNATGLEILGYNYFR